MNKNKNITNEIKKLIRRKTVLFNSIVLIVGVVLLPVGLFHYPGVWFSIFTNVGCGLIASGIISFIIYPSLDTEEQYELRVIKEEKGFIDLFINDDILGSSEERWKKSRNYLDLITRQADDLNVFVKWEDIPARLKVRIITRQPNGKDDKAILKALSVWADKHKDQVEIRYYSGIELPWYCRMDNKCYIGQKLDFSDIHSRVYFGNNSDIGIGELSVQFFERVWNNEKDYVSVSRYSNGRTVSSQAECIEGILKYFCEKNKRDLKLDTDIEAVVAIWTEKRIKRRTFYSCNKQQGKSLHSIRDYSMGVVGMLQNQLKGDAGPCNTNCILFYDREEDKNSCQYIADWRINDINREQVEEQKWDNEATKAMLAISLFRQGDNGPELFGALTYDFAETLKDIDKTILFEDAVKCRDIILPLLSYEIIMDYDNQLLELESVEGEDCGK